MKGRSFFVLGVIASLIATFTLLVAPAGAAKGEKSLTLTSVQYIQGKGVVFKFDVKGDFKESDLAHGVAVINGQTFSLSCHFDDGGGLTCTADQGLANFVGEMAQVTVFGYTASLRVTSHVRTFAPEGGGGYCYSVWDYPSDDEVLPPDEWLDYGPHCQDVPANIGDGIPNQYLPGKWDTVNYYLHGSDAGSCDPEHGPAYYYGTDDCDDDD